MENWMIQWGLSWLQSHQQWIQGALAGWALSHPAMLMRWAWQGAVKVPGLRQALLSNPDGTKKFAEALLQEFERDVDEEAAKPDSTPPAKPNPAAENKIP